MANTIVLKNRSNTSSPAPGTSDLTSGEVAINYHEDVRKLYFKDSGNTVREVLDSQGVDDQATALAIALGQSMANTFKLKTKASLTTSLAAVYTVPSSKTAIILSISLANKTGNSVTGSVQISSDTSDTETNADAYLLSTAPIPSGGTLEVMQGNKLVLQTTDIIKAKASTGSAVDVIISLMEMDV